MSLAKILWVDDEIESLHSQVLFLENKGYEVKEMTNGFDAIDYVKENPIDVVLLDETMPGITGLETLAKIKEVNQQIPVVLITLITRPIPTSNTAVVAMFFAPCESASMIAFGPIL